MRIEPKPAYLTVKTPKQAMIAFHAAEVEHLRASLREQMEAEMDFGRARGEIIDAAWFEDFSRRMAAVKWEDGSVIAVWRDRLAFHEAALEYLTYV